MSTIDVVAGAAGVANVLFSAAQIVISPSLRPYRAIGDIIASATFSEKHDDETVITEHPVENGEISDHAYSRPVVVTLNVGWSPSDPNSGYDNPSYIRSIYDKLLVLKESRVPFKLYTGKRVIENMLIRSMSETTDDKTENILMLTIVCRQIFIVETVTASVSSNQDIQLYPEDTTPTIDSGVHSLRTAPYFDGGNIDEDVGTPIALDYETNP